jgi:hypothetical protein
MEQLKQIQQCKQHALGKVMEQVPYAAWHPLLQYDSVKPQ